LRNQEAPGFNGMIFACIEKALKTLGEGVAVSFFYQIEKKFGLPKEEFVSKPIELISCLEQLLGDAGSQVIEKLIVQEIKTTFQLQGSALTLESAIKSARRSFLTR
jgi:hypothetical protein